MLSSVKNAKLSLKIHYPWNCWWHCLRLIIYRDPPDRLFNPCLTHYPPEPTPPTTASPSTSSLDLLSQQEKDDPTFMAQHTNLPNSPTPTPRMFLLSFMNIFTAQAALHSCGTNRMEWPFKNLTGKKVHKALDLFMYLTL